MTLPSWRDPGSRILEVTRGETSHGREGKKIARLRSKVGRMEEDVVAMHHRSVRIGSNGGTLLVGEVRTE